MRLIWILGIMTLISSPIFAQEDPEKKEPSKPKTDDEFREFLRRRAESKRTVAITSQSITKLVFKTTTTTFPSNYRTLSLILKTGAAEASYNIGCNVKQNKKTLTKEEIDKVLELVERANLRKIDSTKLNNKVVGGKHMNLTVFFTHQGEEYEFSLSAPYGNYGPYQETLEPLILHLEKITYLKEKVERKLEDLDDDKEDDEKADVVRRADKLCKSVIGMREKKACNTLKEAGLEYRIVERDGTSFPGTCDFEPARINLVIKNGKVIDATRG